MKKKQEAPNETSWDLLVEMLVDYCADMKPGEVAETLLDPEVKCGYEWALDQLNEGDEDNETDTLRIGTYTVTGKAWHTGSARRRAEIVRRVTRALKSPTKRRGTK